MSDFDDDDLEFDDDLPELDLSDLDNIEEVKGARTSRSSALTKYEQPDDIADDGDIDALIEYEAMRALDINEYGDEDEETLLDDEDDAEYYDYTEEDFEDEVKKKKGGKKALKIIIGILIFLLTCAAFLRYTKPGRQIAYKIAAMWIHSNVNQEPVDDPDDNTVFVPGDTEDTDPKNVDDPNVTPEITPELIDTPEVVDVVKEPRSEDYVRTYLLFGVESIYVDNDGVIRFDSSSSGNTDAIILLSVNTRDNSIKLTSLLRDTYVEIPGYKESVDGVPYGDKINSVYSKGFRTGETSEEKKKNGAELLMKVIENTYDIDITGYAFVNFSSFEKIIDRLGGIDLQLGEKEAAYLCKTNYISKEQYRTVQPGWNHMNGNQVLGYCRVRKEVTLGGASNDYGRTQRQRRVINAVVQQYKSLSFTSMYSVLKDCLGYINTSLTEDQFAELLENVVENKTYTINQMRLPADELFVDSGRKGKWNGYTNITYAIVLDGYLEQNIKRLHQFVFLDEEEGSAPQ